MPSEGQSGGSSTAAQHAASRRGSLKVAPTDGSTKFNTIRIPLIPVACWRVDDPGFAFDSSFVAPAFRDDVSLLREILEANAGCPAALFGHCDPAGSDELNKVLGDRRVTAIYALLTRQPNLWSDIYDHPAVGDTWGTAAIQCILASLVGADAEPYYQDAIDGQYGQQTSAAVQEFQQDCGLTTTGQADAATRTVLFGAYMDWLCGLDAAPSSNSASGDAAQHSLMKPEGFLGGQGAGAGDLPKMSLQGCSKFNPVVLVPASEMNTTGDKTVRNQDDAPNRRVVMFLFPQDTEVDPSVWPCPKVNDSYDACKSAFWPDGDQRRQNGATLRIYSDTLDTMACRFYDRFARRSPCELGLTVRTWLQDSNRQRMPSIEYRLTMGTTTRTGTADGDGKLTEKGLPFKAQCYVEWGSPIHDDSNGVDMYPYARFLALDFEVDAQEKALANLAYAPRDDVFADDEGDDGAGASDTSDALAAFQADYPNGTPEDVNADGTPKGGSAPG
jgi:hypothetical protein